MNKLTLTISAASYTGKVTATLTDIYGKPVAVASFVSYNNREYITLCGGCV